MLRILRFPQIKPHRMIELRKKEMKMEKNNEIGRTQKRRMGRKELQMLMM